MLLLPARGCDAVSCRVGAGQRHGPHARARHGCRAASRAARSWQEAAASAADGAGEFARRGDGASGRGKLPDRAGQGAQLVAGGLSRGDGVAQGRHAADTAFNPARIRRRLSPGAASERLLTQRPAVFVDAHPRIPQRPFANDLPAALQLGFIRLGARGLRLSRAVDQRLAGVELRAFVGAGRRRGCGQQSDHDRDGALRRDHHHPNVCRASFAPAPSAINLASAISRRIGAMPQLVVATMLLFGTNFETASITLTTSSAVSTSSLATSITPACTILPLSSASSSSGTLELRHSIATCWIVLLLIAGKMSSYCRHWLPSVSFQSVLALMP